MEKSENSKSFEPKNKSVIFDIEGHSIHYSISQHGQTQTEICCIYSGRSTNSQVNTKIV